MLVQGGLHGWTQIYQSAHAYISRVVGAMRNGLQLGGHDARTAGPSSPGRHRSFGGGGHEEAAEHNSTLRRYISVLGKLNDPSSKLVVSNCQFSGAL